MEASEAFKSIWQFNFQLINMGENETIRNSQNLEKIEDINVPKSTLRKIFYREERE